MILSYYTHSVKLNRLIVQSLILLENYLKQNSSTKPVYKNTLLNKFSTRIAKLEEENAELVEALEVFSLCCWDLETTGLTANFGHVLSACFKSPGRPVISYRIDDYDSWQTEMWNDYQIVKAIREELTKYDVVITYNGTQYDWKFLTTRLLKHRLEPVKPALHIDLLNLPRHQLLLGSNRLANVLAFLGTQDQKTILYPDIWDRASHGDKEGMDYIVEHCEQDVISLEQAFKELKPFIRNIFKRR